MSDGFIKLMRSQETGDLLECPDAFYLLARLALQARWHDSWNKHNLKPGQALASRGRLPRQRYRTAIAVLTKAHLATFQATNKGTIATLTSTMVFDINLEATNHQSNQQVTTNQPTSNHQPTINQPLTKKERMKEGKNTSAQSAVEVEEPSEHKHLIELWHDAYRAHFDTPYPFAGGRDGKAVKDLLRFAGSPDAVLSIATAAWSNLSGFLLQHAATLHGLASKWSEINVAMKTGLKAATKVRSSMMPVGKPGDFKGGDITEQIKRGEW
jgi:hypothetical protein